MYYVRFAAFTAVTVMNALIWVVASCSLIVAGKSIPQYDIRYYGCDDKECRVLGYRAQSIPKRKHIKSSLQSTAG
jgi:hypothetical protein